MKTVKKTAVVLILVIAVATLFSCGGIKIDPGTISGNIFTNDYFGIELELPGGFLIASNEDWEEAWEAGGELLNVDQKTYDYSKEQTVPLFLVTEQDSDYYDMSIMAQAEKLSLIASVSVKNEYDYIEHLKKNLTAMDNSDISVFFKDTEEVMLGGKKFYKFPMISTYYEDMSLNQDIYCYKKNDYILFIGISYDGENENHLEIIDTFLNSIKFK